MITEQEIMKRINDISSDYLKPFVKRIDSEGYYPEGYESFNWYKKVIESNGETL